MYNPARRLAGIIPFPSGGKTNKSRGRRLQYFLKGVLHSANRPARPRRAEQASFFSWQNKRRRTLIGFIFEQA
jgi:hypothetical protein